MTNRPATLTPDQLEDRAAIAFLEQYVDDVATGRRAALADYLARHPGFEARIAHEWLLLSGRLSAAAPVAMPADRVTAGTIGPYELVRELGRGGQGTVYLARDPGLDRAVALKVLAKDLTSLAGPARLRLQREADALARLEHPGIATVYATGQTGDQAWIAMRYVAGGSLAEAIEARVAAAAGPPRERAEISAIVRLVERAARALAVAHGAGILHRDIKPANLLLAAADEPVLVDFGLAADAAAGSGGRTPQLTVPGALFGTLCYLAPERLAGDDAEARGDVYALGAVLFELLTLSRPFAAATTAAELKAIVEAPLPDVRERNAAVSRDLALVTATALARAPGDRYQTAAAFADDLACVRDRQPIAARPAGPVLRTWRWAQRNPGLALSLSALAAVLTIGLALTSWLWRDSAANLADVRRLADLRLVRHLVERATELWPARPERLPDLRAWQADAAALQARLPHHRERLGALPAGDDPTGAWEREQLTALVAEHERLVAASVSITDRIALAADLRRRTLDEPAQAWAAATARIAASEHYGGLHLAPQLGLVPLGPDPDSGLEEFAHTASGRVPQRGGDGRLVLDGASAIVLVLVPGGDALVGAEPAPPSDGHAANLDPTASAALGPCQVVPLAPFLLGKHELTQEQWRRHTGTNPSAYRVGGDLTSVVGERHPVELVSWLECDRLLRELDLALPTEAQWEWAYRAGTHTVYPYGDDPHSLAGHENLADAASRQRGGSGHWRYIEELDDGHLVHAPVGSFLPNAFGLHDLGGNVKEWCRDSWEDYPDCPARAGDGLREGRHADLRVVRGACFSSYLDEPRAASRGGSPKDTSGSEAGVRAARAIAP